LSESPRYILKAKRMKHTEILSENKFKMRISWLLYSQLSRNSSELNLPLSH